MSTTPIPPSPPRPGATAAAAPAGAAPGVREAPRWSGPAPLRSLVGLSGAYRASVHRMNVRTRDASARAYEAYLEAWREGARRCGSAAALRAHGPPAVPAPGLEPGGTLAEDRDLDPAYQRQLHAYLAATREAGDLVLRLERRPVPLEAFFDVAVTARLELGGGTWGGTLSARGGAAPEAGARGVVLQPGRLEAGVEAGVVGARAVLAGGRVETVEVSARALPGVRGFARRSRDAVEHGVAIGGRVGGRGGGPAVQLEARASAGLNLLGPEVVRRAISPRSFWDGDPGARGSADGEEAP